MQGRRRQVSQGTGGGSWNQKERKEKGHINEIKFLCSQSIPHISFFGEK